MGTAAHATGTGSSNRSWARIRVLCASKISAANIPPLPRLRSGSPATSPARCRNAVTFSSITITNSLSTVLFSSKDSFEPKAGRTGVDPFGGDETIGGELQLHHNGSVSERVDHRDKFDGTGAKQSHLRAGCRSHQFLHQLYETGAGQHRPAWKMTI